jgi:hypothetical protein
MKEKNIISFQEAASSPIFQAHLATIQSVERQGPALAVTNKFLEGQKELIEEELEAIFEQTPDLSLHFVLSKIMENMPDYLSGSILLDLTKFAIEKWENMQEKVLHRV